MYNTAHRIKIVTIPLWLQRCIRISQIERTRNQRRLNHSRGWRILVRVAMLCATVAIGVSAYLFGTALNQGHLTGSLDMVRVATTMGSFSLLLMFKQRTSKYSSHINSDHLLTTVPTREVVLGIVLTVLYPVAIPLSFVVAGGAIGFAIATQSPLTVFTLIVAVSGLLILTALLGVALNLLVEFITTRSAHFNKYKNGLGVIAFGLCLGLVAIVISGLISSSYLFSWLSVGPAAWFVDLGFAGSPVIQSVSIRSVGALTVVVSGVPALLVGATALANRVWRTEPVSIATLHHSRTLIGAGVTERLFAGYVSRPVLTVARKRWLQERRVPLGLTMLSWSAPFLLVVIGPILAVGAVPGVSLVLFAFIGAVGTGLSLGFFPVGTEYSSLPMTLTTLTGEQFIRGELLASNTIGATVTAVGTVVLALGSSLHILESLLIALGSVTLCVCSSALAVSLGMRVSYRDLIPIPLPLTSATIYTEIGRASFVRMGVLVGMLVIVCLPAFGGYLLSFVSVFISMPPALGTHLPIAIVRISSLLMMICLAIVVSQVFYRRAVRQYDQYTLA